jgi:MFS family permease
MIMEKTKLHWYDQLTINSYWLGINIASGTGSILMPFLIALYMPSEYKNTYLATLRVIGLAVAMLVQPLAGMLSDRSTSAWGRRRPFIFASAILNVVFLAIIGSSQYFAAPDYFKNGPIDTFFWAAFGVSAAFAVLLIGNVLWQVSSNIGHGPLQGLIPDLVPEKQRGISSGVKSTFEVLPILLMIFIGPLVNSGKIWLVVGILMAGFVLTMLVTVVFVKEKPLSEKPKDSLREPVLRLVALMVIFVAITQVGLLLVQNSGRILAGIGASLVTQVVVTGLVGLLAMAGAIFLGVYAGAWIGIGRHAHQHRGFIWWVVNRLLFLAAVAGIRDFAQNYLRDVLKIENAASMSGYLLAVIGIFLVIAALVGGYLSDRIGRRRLIALAGIIAAAGAFLIIPFRSLIMVFVGGSFVGLGAGLFMAANWALGTDLVPPEDAGKYLGISNLAGAGAGIVGTGIGGPMADFFNQLSPGLGYEVIYGIYGTLFLISILVLRIVRKSSEV